MPTNCETCQLAFAHPTANGSHLYVVFALTTDERNAMGNVGKRLVQWPVYFDANERPLAHGDVCRADGVRGLVRCGKLGQEG